MWGVRGEGPQPHLQGAAAQNFPSDPSINFIAEQFGPGRGRGGPAFPYPNQPGPNQVAFAYPHLPRPDHAVLPHFYPPKPDQAALPYPHLDGPNQAALPY